MIVKIQRKKCDSNGTLGTLFIDCKEFCQTLELPWLNNAENVSCIPTGKYTCKKITSPTKRIVFEICDVPNRTHVLLHIANYQRELRGCVALGMISGEENGKYCVYRSKDAFDLFMSNMRDVNEFVLYIEE